jgi:hypothetical protein
MRLHGVGKKNGSGQKGTGFAPEKKKYEAEQKEDAELPDQKAGQQGRKEVAVNVQLAGLTPKQNAKNPD